MLNQPSLCRTAGLILGVFLSLGPSLASAQSGEPEGGEISGYGALGLGAGTQPVAGASAGVAFSRHGMGLFDFSFMPMGTHTIQTGPAASTVHHSYLYDFALDFHIRFPIKERLEPYAIVGNGLLWNPFTQNMFTSEGIAVGYRYSQFNWAFHTGGGVRYFVGKNWGLRPEVKVIVSKDVYTRISMGIFYVTPPDWP